eukprot:1161696-Pelagomonas_calceolata.AAC.14
MDNEGLSESKMGQLASCGPGEQSIGPHAPSFPLEFSTCCLQGLAVSQPNLFNPTLADTTPSLGDKGALHTTRFHSPCKPQK